MIERAIVFGRLERLKRLNECALNLNELNLYKRLKLCFYDDRMEVRLLVQV